MSNVRASILAAATVMSSFCNVHTLGGSSGPRVVLGVSRPWTRDLDPRVHGKYYGIGQRE